MRNICLYSPYLKNKHMGGGEKYLLDCARFLGSDSNTTVSVAISGSFSASELEARRKEYQDFLGQSLENVRFIDSPLGTEASSFSKLRWTSQWDDLYALLDGSFFLSLSHRTLGHVQFPFTHTMSLADRLKYLTWDGLSSNAEFTKEIIESHWPAEISWVHQPMISPLSTKANNELLDNKERVILHVGRFFRQLHSKRQDVLVKMFRELRTKAPQKTKDWRLVLVGSVEDQNYANEVAEQAEDLPVTIHHDLDRKSLEKLFLKASIYWHATGYGVDVAQHPEKVEHFGITTVEAMSAAAVPVVINLGGQRETVTGSLERLRWNTIEEGVSTTLGLIDDQRLREEIASEAREQANHFDGRRFAQILEVMFPGVSIDPTLYS